MVSWQTGEKLLNGNVKLGKVKCTQSKSYVTSITMLVYWILKWLDQPVLLCVGYGKHTINSSFVFPPRVTPQKFDGNEDLQLVLSINFQRELNRIMMRQNAN